MDINITQLLGEDMFEYSHSAHEGGQDAGRNTWNAALKGPRPLLNTPEEIQALRDHIQAFGAWSEDEIAAWDDNECQALFLQLIAGDVRECPAILNEVEFEKRETVVAGDVRECPEYWFYQTLKDKKEELESGPFASRNEAYEAASNELVGWNQQRSAESIDEIDWPEYEVQASAGRISGGLFKAEDGQVYYSLGF
jgi:hypothetical protein